MHGAEHPLSGADLPSDAAELGLVAERTAVFGRLSPQQKRDLVRALQARGHVVAMAGDGVNDVLALKVADVSVAMGSGSAAARAVARLTLVHDSFASVPFAIRRRSPRDREPRAGCDLLSDQVGLRDGARGSRGAARDAVPTPPATTLARRSPGHRRTGLRPIVRPERGASPIGIRLANADFRHSGGCCRRRRVLRCI